MNESLPDVAAGNLAVNPMDIEPAPLAREKSPGSMLQHSADGSHHGNKTNQRPAIVHGGGAPRARTGDRFHELFTQHWKATGGFDQNATAIELSDKSYSFADLEQLSNQLAHYLISRGVTNGAVVALLFDRTIESYISVLAVSKAGAAYVPLDVGFPDDRIAFICEDSAAVAALCLTEQQARFDSAAIETIALDLVNNDIARHPATPLPKDSVACAEDTLSYIIYTSGTTGRPKGVPINHLSICNFLIVAAEQYGFTADDRVFQSLTLAFDYSFEEIWVPLLCGSSLVPAPSGVSLLGDDLADFLAENRITAWCSVPTVLLTIEQKLPLLKLLIVSGEACPPELVNKWATGGRRLLNLYGPTETTVSATWKAMQPGEKLTIGHPLPSYSALILSPDEPRVLNVGVEGELVLAGVGLANGYLNRPAENNRAFITDFLNLQHNPGGKLYRTGDLALIDSAGEIEYRGRVDTQVKIRGYRIELAEIESQARELSGISNLVVDAVEVEKGRKELVLYYVNGQNNRLQPNKLQVALREKLPSYMVPTYFEALDEMPLLPSQKVNRKSLPPPNQKSRLVADQGPCIAPRTPLEQVLCSELASLLSLDKVSTQANFINDLGLNSLLLARYLAALRNKINYPSLSMRMVYTRNTIAELAEELLRQTPTENDTAIQTDLQGNDKHNLHSDSQTPNNHHTVSRTRFVLFGVAQMLWMMILAGVFTAAAVGVINWLWAVETSQQLLWRSLGGSTLLFGTTVILSIAVKWIAVGRFTPGAIPLWSMLHLRFWMAELAVKSNPMVLFTGTPLYNVYLRAMGAKIGRGVLIFSAPPTCTDLIEIGDHTLIRQTCTFSGYTARNGLLQPGRVEIGRNCYISEATTLEINSRLGEGATLGSRSALHEGQRTGDGQVWWGSPAVVGNTDFIRVSNTRYTPLKAWSYSLGQLLVTGLILPAMLFYSTKLIIDWYETQTITQPDILELAGLSAGFYLGGIVVALIYIGIAPKFWNLFFKPGQEHQVFSFQFFVASRLTKSSNSPALLSLFGDSSLVVPYLAFVGYNLKNLRQTGSNFGVIQTHHSPFLCEFSNNTLVSDGLAMDNMDISLGCFKMSQITVPGDTYLGNDLHYPADAKIGRDCLIGTRALIPTDGKLRENVGILGSPPFEIPRPVRSDPRFEHYLKDGIFQQRLTLKLKSNLITIGWYMFRNWSFGFIVLLLSISVFSTLYEHNLIDPFSVGITTGVLATLLLLVRSLYIIVFLRIADFYRPVQVRTCSLYDKAFWDHERIWRLGNDPMRDRIFAGTPMKNLMAICQGVKLGKQVFDNGCSFPEPTLVTIGDYCNLNNKSIVQCHSLEDGIFKSDKTSLGNYCTLGVQAFVHYGVITGEQAHIQTDAFVMKGSRVAAFDGWAGNPAEPKPEISAF